MINTAGGVVSLIMIPVAGFMMKRIDARYLAVAGLSFAAFALWNLAGLSPDAGYWDLAFRRGLQTFAGAFLFSPVMAAAFRGVPDGKADNASSLITTAAGLGGSFGIALLTTLLANNTRYHVGVLSAQASNYNPNYVGWMERTTQSLQNAGLTAVEAAGKAQGIMFAEIHRQGLMLAFIDVFYYMMILVICAIPLIFLFKPGVGKKKK